MTTHFKQPVSVLVVIYTAKLQVLLLERADHPGYWQSVTGSREPGELLTETVLREVYEETGIDARLYSLSDWRSQNVYEIYPQWRYRYQSGIIHNTEHVFGLQLPHPVDIQLEPREHLNYQWVPWQDAADKVFSPSNRAAILDLANRIHVNGRIQASTAVQRKSQ
jgi:dATP pyrophosphohydrolase